MRGDRTAVPAVGTVSVKAIARNDGLGAATILLANDIAGSHGKTYLFVGFDEIHSYRTHDLFEALAADPTRPDVLTWIRVCTQLGIPGFGQA